VSNRVWFSKALSVRAGRALKFWAKDRYYIPSYFARRLLFSSLRLSVQLIYRGDMGRHKAALQKKTLKRKGKT
jgi:hypothetical protein